jgi:hypothetical protein
MLTEDHGTRDILTLTTLVSLSGESMERFNRS